MSTTLSYTISDPVVSSPAVLDCGDNPGWGMSWGSVWGGCPSDFEFEFIARLLRFTRGDTNFPLLVRVLAARVEAELYAAETVANAFDLDTATGYTLDIIGSTLQQTRKGLPDDDYRRVLQIQVQLLLSSVGTGAVLRRIVELWTDEQPEFYVEWQAAHVLMTATVLSSRIDYLLSMLNTAKPAGVTLTLLVTEAGADALTADSTISPIAGIVGVMDSTISPVTSPGYMGKAYTV